MLVLAIATGPGAAPDTQRIHLDGPVLLPTLIPLTIALGEQPSVGKTYTLPMFDPIGMAAKQATFRVTAESSFVVLALVQLSDPATERLDVFPDLLRLLALILVVLLR